ncbi:MAG: VapC family ribonuclease [Thermodesulfobacteria bacterium]|nr:type II toxin-antitoxin system VapC family toxin [Thermodesulfobacteriota bacterium]MCU4137428.1 VapC family ribonuclease [Thermodesulfobacteriota bacterium]
MKSEKSGKRKLLCPSDLENLILGKRVLIDTNIIIYLTDMVWPYEELSRLLFSLIEEGRAEGVISVVSVAEVMQGPLKMGMQDKALKVREYLLNFPHILIQGVDKDVLNYIGTDKRIDWLSLRVMDSLIIASGLKANAEKIISNDLRFRKAVPKDLLISFDLD